MQKLSIFFVTSFTLCALFLGMHFPLNASQTMTRCSSISSLSQTDPFAELPDLKPTTQSISIEEAHGIEPQSYNDYFTSLASHSTNTSDMLPTLQFSDLTTFSPEPEEDNQTNKRIKESPAEETTHATTLQIPTTPTSMLSIPSPNSSTITTPRSCPLSPLQLSPFLLSPQLFRLPVAQTESMPPTPLSSPYGSLPHFFASSSINSSSSSSSASSSSTTSTTSVVANSTPQTSTRSTALVALPEDPIEQLLILIPATNLPCPTITYPATKKDSTKKAYGTCTTCSKEFTEDVLDQHTQVHIKNPFYCRLCDHVFQTFKELATHWVSPSHKRNYLYLYRLHAQQPQQATANALAKTTS